MWESLKRIGCSILSCLLMGWECGKHVIGPHPSLMNFCLKFPLVWIAWSQRGYLALNNSWTSVCRDYATFISHEINDSEQENGFSGLDSDQCSIVSGYNKPCSRRPLQINSTAHLVCCSEGIKSRWEYQVDLVMIDEWLSQVELFMKGTYSPIVLKC